MINSCALLLMKWNAMEWNKVNENGTFKEIQSQLDYCFLN